MHDRPPREKRSTFSIGYGPGAVNTPGQRRERLDKPGRGADNDCGKGEGIYSVREDRCRIAALSRKRPPSARPPSFSPPGSSGRRPSLPRRLRDRARQTHRKP
ncbi:MAG: hypothetical protein MZV64_64050 [Ignavibacteriales bacterium]|nr:hypothetical protein [Ignavibacteriales bacterium]